MAVEQAAKAVTNTAGNVLGFAWKTGKTAALLSGAGVALAIIFGGPAAMGVAAANAATATGAAAGTAAAGTTAATGVAATKAIGIKEYFMTAVEGYQELFTHSAQWLAGVAPAAAAA